MAVEKINIPQKIDKKQSILSKILKGRTDVAMIIGKGLFTNYVFQQESNGIKFPYEYHSCYGFKMNHIVVLFSDLSEFYYEITNN
jgi:hypothetical protein